MANSKVVWEELKNDVNGVYLAHTFRAKIPGGWLIRIADINGYGCGITFYPDPNHAWDGGSIP